MKTTGGSLHVDSKETKMAPSGRREEGCHGGRLSAAGKKNNFLIPDAGCEKKYQWKTTGSVCIWYI